MLHVISTQYPAIVRWDGMGKKAPLNSQPDVEVVYYCISTIVNHTKGTVKLGLLNLTCDQLREERHPCDH